MLCRKLKTFSIALTALAAVLCQAVPASASAAFVTGRDWTEKMTTVEKFMSIAGPMFVLQSYGVPFRHAPQHYIPAVEAVIRNNPHLLGEDVANIFASAVYVYEPEARGPMDELETRFLRGEFDKEPVRLLVPTIDN